MKYIISFGIVLLILFLPFYINIKVMKTKKENVLKIGIGIFDNKLKLFYKINQNKFKEKTRTKLNKNFYTYLEKKYDGFYNEKKKNKYITFFKSILNHLSIKALIIETKLGFQDAAQTAIVVGIILSIKSYFIAYLKSKIKIDNVSFKVLPIFCINTVEVNFNCIIKYKLVYIITAGLNCLKVRKKVVD